MHYRFILVAVFLVGLLLPQPGQAADDAAVQTAWRLLDYIAVDYPGAVEDGRVVSQSEYDEMVEFSESVRNRLGQLPFHPQQAQLQAEIIALEAAIAARAMPTDVAKLARGLAVHLLDAYPVPLAPTKTPDVSRGASLYAEQCASCHGLSGAGDGPAATNLDPPPIAFTDRSRAQERSLFALYQVITQGLDGTAMPSFAQLSPEDRWALAFHTGTLAYPMSLASEGERLWRSDPTLRAVVPKPEALAGITPAQLAVQVGDERAAAVTAYLRRHPEALSPAQGSSLDLARTRLTEAVQAYGTGDRRRATDLALSAYLDGFEPFEPRIGAKDSALLGRVEAAMNELRAGITRGQPAEAVGRQAAAVTTLFNEVERTLAEDTDSNVTMFVGAATILLREGLEALLIVIAMIAFLRKAGREEVLPYVHGGWAAALVAGGATWFAATYIIAISGASRELTEGFGSLFAALILVSVGIWMHGKSHADNWQRYIRERLSHALSRRSGWVLFLLAFVVVYREVFETILFYSAMWRPESATPLLGGIACAVVLLGIIGWAALRYSRQLPIGRFFAVSSLLVAVISIVLAGKGIAALQEAGLLDVQPLAGLPRLAALGVYPTVEGVAVQLATLAVIMIGFWYNRRHSLTQTRVQT
ncbi:cytochrome c/FTR1 family iron permease [Paeniroseomonas aquatica]|uniref:Cytochrome c/FTR1 family iron permease n=1 Tax=Paeniroseomonas aquatica TaxID=373043 RepID=A0ABT8A900_9PROT|nr:cytochrome c/FTR1 family iron permease [Paeniroseomonas aquatica]MDN3566247.1 cytochrome c/FTR1 family iron permease [Paeniroseomonas aquatica]